MDEAGEKSLDPTPHRRQQAREEGQVVKSQDLSAAAVLVVSLAALLNLCGPLVEFFGGFTRQQLGGDAWLSTDAETVSDFTLTMVAALGKAAWPLFAVFLGAGVAAHLFQTGFLFLPDKLMPDWDRINPLSGWARIFSMAGAVQLVLGLFKIAVVAGVAWWSVAAQQDQILALSGLDANALAGAMAGILLWISIKVCLALLVLALLDYLFQFWRHEQGLKMTPQEVREEMKSLQGDPQLIARRRNVQRQLVLNRMKSAVPKADVIITNPTELAIAIQYDPESMAAPVVVAKGAGVLAQRIRRLALEHGIPIVEKKPLAQTLYKEVDLNHPIPGKLYAAVAEVLAYVYQLKGKPLPNGQ